MSSKVRRLISGTCREGDSRDLAPTADTLSKTFYPDSQPSRESDMRRSPRSQSMSRIIAIVTLALLVAHPALSSNETGTERAKAVFASLDSLSRAFDPAAADLYSDEAKIVSLRHYPWGLPDKKLELSGTQYKDLIRKSMGIARARGDVSTYSEISYTAEGANVRIRCTRYSELKKYSAPHSLLVGPVDDGRWLVLEEVSETRP